MSLATVRKKLEKAALKDPMIFCERSDLDKTLGNDFYYLRDLFGFTKSDLIRLERLGFAFKARYQTENKSNRKVRISKDVEIPVTGPHRIRWVLFKDVLNA